MVKRLESCGRELTGTYEAYVIFSEGAWKVLSVAQVGKHNRDYRRPCGGRTVYSDTPDEIRLCMDCAALNGVVW